MTKNGQQGERKPRTRPGEWKRETRTVEMPNVGEVTAKVIVVTFEGHRWEVPDTKDGRHKATLAIQAVRDVARDLRQTERLRDKVRDLCKCWPGVVGDLLAKASDNLTTAMEHMGKKG